MHSMQQLLFAQRFPFSEAAKRIVAQQNLSLSELPEAVVERAAAMVEHAIAGERYVFSVRNSDLLLQEVLAFPVAKILVSFLKDEKVNERFALLFAEAVLNYLNSEREVQETAVALASDLQLQFDIAELQPFSVSVPLQRFLGIRFNDPLLKLVNQSVSGGKVFLDLNGFARFLKALVFEKIAASLPVSTSGIPKNLEAVAFRFRQNFREKQSRQIQFVFTGKAQPNAFPPCMNSLYEQLLSGQKLQHMARFYLASFLNRVAVPKQQILEAFKKSPDFKEKISSYQIDRIVKQNYTPPSCDKIRAAGFCPNADCNVRHPLSFYRRQLRKGQAKPIAKE